MKHSTVLLPVLLPQLSDQTATQVVDLLQQLLAIIQHHYAPQLERHRQRLPRTRHYSLPSATAYSDEPF